MLQLYYGDGKGKTTAAAGAVVRMIGAGGRAGFVQFLKNGDSSELAALRRLGVDCMVARESYQLFEAMTPARTQQLADVYRALLADALHRRAEWDLLVLDEVLDACAMKLLDPDALCRALHASPGNCEVILTGHAPLPALTDAADYITHFRCERHPYAHGAAARKGIEF